MDSSIQDVKAASEFIGILMVDALLSIIITRKIPFLLAHSKIFSMGHSGMKTTSKGSD